MLNLQDLVSTYAFHNYDNVKRSQTKKDPRRIHYSSRAAETHSLIFAAYKGDLTSLRRMALRGTNMNLADYDGRTALHVAAAEGKLEICQFLIEKCQVHLDCIDRWGKLLGVSPIGSFTYCAKFASNSPKKEHQRSFEKKPR